MDKEIQGDIGIKGRNITSRRTLILFLTEPGRKVLLQNDQGTKGRGALVPTLSDQEADSFPAGEGKR